MTSPPQDPLVSVDSDLEMLLDEARCDLERPHRMFEENDIQRVLLMLGTSRNCAAYQSYRDEARSLAAAVSAWSAKQQSQEKIWVCSGGKGGLMSAVSEGVATEGEHALGFGFANSGHPTNHNQHEQFTHLFSELGLRDFWLYHRAVAIVAFPGGLGTLAELFDALLHMQLGMRSKVPVFLYGSKFWRAALNTASLLEHGVASKEDLEAIRFCDTVEDVLKEFLEE